MYHQGLRQHPTLRDELLCTRSLAQLREVLDRVDAAGWQMPQFHAADARPDLSWYFRYRHATPPPEWSAAGAAASSGDATEADGASATGDASETLTREEAERRFLQKRAEKKQARRQKAGRRKFSSRRQRKAANREGTAVAEMLS